MVQLTYSWNGDAILKDLVGAAFAGIDRASSYFHTRLVENLNISAGPYTRVRTRNTTGGLKGSSYTAYSSPSAWRNAAQTDGVAATEYLPAQVPRDGSDSGWVCPKRSLWCDARTRNPPHGPAPGHSEHAAGVHAAHAGAAEGDTMTDVDNDTLEAVKIVWQRSPAIAEIMPLPPQQAPLKRRPAASQYGVHLQEEKRDQAATGGVWFDFRRVEIKIRGLKPDVVNASQTVRGVFVHGLKLPYPSGVSPWGSCRTRTRTMNGTKRRAAMTSGGRRSASLPSP